MGALPPASALPVIDLSELDGPQHDQLTKAIVAASQRFGVFQVVNHGLSVEFFEELKETGYHFFNLPEEEKKVYIVEEVEGTPVRYAPGSPLAPVDVLVMTGDSEEYALKHWPDSCKEVAVKYQKFCGELAERIIRLLLNDLGVAVDESMMNLYTAEKEVFMNHYPIFSNENLEISAVTKHTDPYTLSVLLQDHVGGLFANKEGEWVQIEPVAGALIVIVADCLEVISNGKYKAAEHFVRTTGRETRVSFAVFMHPKSTSKIQPLPQLVEKDVDKPRYREFTFKEHYDNICSGYASPTFRAMDSLRSY